MSPTYSINIKNASLERKQFLLFQVIPHPANIPWEEVFTNVYQRSVQVEGNGSSRASFQVTNQYWAVYGMPEQCRDGQTKVTTSDSRNVVLGPNGSYFVLSTMPGPKGTPDGVSPCFDDAASHKDITYAPGAFTIRSDGSFNYNESSTYFGVGAQDPRSGKIIPVQTYRAKPNVVSEIFPRSKYCIAFGDYEPGSVVNMNQLGNVLEVDFTNAVSNSCTFTLDASNNYVPDANLNNSGIHWRVTTAV
ncbi:hypothetical protein FCIRC_2407 [Fusarium circinatum]|uniref:Uncharacterized protein n=1 Tax=Fusarium circinatum TaxID=48490 RepID=A0A8H5UD53_FUSCI|nr:hypothetical protein FCIRC_2407 [Fusarium circinatum]